MLRNQKGFTLMELMIVIVIIGVLAAIGVPAYTGYVNKAKSATCDSNKRPWHRRSGSTTPRTALIRAKCLSSRRSCRTMPT